jgi:hypothetical protein
MDSLTSIMSTTGARRYSLLTRPGALKALMGKPPRSADESAEYAVSLFKAIGGPGFAPDEEALRKNGRLAFERKPSPRGFCRHFAAIGASGDRTARLATIRTPTLVFHGAADPLIAVAAGRATARAIPGARLEVVDGMGHHLPPGVWDRLIEAISANAARARSWRGRWCSIDSCTGCEGVNRHRKSRARWHPPAVPRRFPSGSLLRAGGRWLTPRRGGVTLSFGARASLPHRGVPRARLRGAA